MNRNKSLQQLTDESIQWDFVVIGGGASGLGSAIDAVSRGFKTLLLESHDFCKGTSSRSTKLIHGGVRYMAQGYIDLVKEALKERGLLSHNAAHLVKTQDFVIPNYTLWNSFLYAAGLTFYDFLSGKLSLGKTRLIGKKKTLKELPNIKAEGLRSGVVYTDGQFDDSRLGINMAQTIDDLGGCAINYMEADGFIKNEQGKIIGVEATDKISGKKYTIHCKVVINATGVFANEILNEDNPHHGKFIVPSQGIHIVLNKSFLLSDNAVMIPKTSDGRVLFIVPWHDKCLVGTTDTLVEEPNYEPRALEKEIEFVMESAQMYLNKKPTRKDVLSVFAGLRPLAAPKQAGKSTKEVSRSHKVVAHESGMLTLTGGKWTSYRKMAKDVIDKAIEVHELTKAECRTHRLSIHGNIPKKEVDRSSHLYVYGSDIPQIKEIQQEKPEYAAKIHSNYGYTFAEVIWAIREEMALTVEDILARRVRLLFLDAQAAIDCAPKIASVVAQEIGKDKKWEESQVDEFTKLARNYLLG
ncbi:MAG: glycerol-3-phosphate dehydrogenase/oxidase [Dysgonamonadaceae bacterium]|jgi:glycerol-3-phosphate dehydrogenase|nr:glycerol-3-phosphate dehydrogenase/oxidase [Dysgonamonadaceae bacterium]